MTIYIDVLFAVNMFINYFLLLIAGGFAKTVCNRLRLFIASTIGGIYCVLMYTANVSLLLSALLKIASTFIISIIAFKFINFSHFLRCSLVLSGVGFLFGGLVYGIFFLFEPSIMDIRNSTIYIHVSPVFLVLCSAISYIVILFFSYLLKPQMISENSSYQVTICYREKSVSAVGFVDTGNLLSDIFTDFPVILCSFKTIEGLMSSEEAETLSNPYSIGLKSVPNSFRLIPLSTVSGSSLLPSFKPDCVLLKSQEKEYCIERVLVAVFNPQNYDSPHKIILNPELVVTKGQGGKVDVR